MRGEARRLWCATSGVQQEAGRKLTEIFVDGDACPVREEIYRVAARLQLNVLVVSNGSRPIRPPGTSNVRMVLVSDSADAADDSPQAKWTYQTGFNGRTISTSTSPARLG